MSARETGAVSALAAAAAIGPFFAWEERSGDGWLPLTDLHRPEVVAGRVRTPRAMLVERFGLRPEAVPERVVASVLSLGLAARLVSPPLAAVAVADVLPVPVRGGLWWRPVDSGPVPVAFTAIGAVDIGTRPDDAVAGVFAEVIVDGLVAPVLEVFRDRFRLSPKVLWGNVASALGGAVTMLRGARPDRVDRAGGIVERLLTTGPLRGAASVERPQWTLRRNNCCLYYRIPGGGYCGDCVLRRSR